MKILYGGRNLCVAILAGATTLAASSSWGDTYEASVQIDLTSVGFNTLAAVSLIEKEDASILLSPNQIADIRPSGPMLASIRGSNIKAMRGRACNGTRCSPLDQVHRDNVGLNIFPAWRVMNDGTDQLGNFIAWGAAKGEIVWSLPEPFSVRNGALATGGDVVFYGTLEGYLKAQTPTTGPICTVSPHFSPRESNEAVSCAINIV